MKQLAWKSEAPDAGTNAADMELQPTDASPKVQAVAASGVHLPLLRENLFKTVNYCLLFSLVGMSDASLGAALPGLTCLAGTTEQRVAFLFLFHEMAVLMVTLLVGFLNRRNSFGVETNRGRLQLNLLLTLVSLLMPCCFLLVPQCRSLSTLAMAFSLMGLLEGCLEFFCNIQMLCLYRCHAGPFLQAMFFCQSLGAFISPLVIGAFMSSPGPREWLNCTARMMLDSLDYAPVSADAAPAAASGVPDELEEILVRVRWPFYLIAGLQFPILLSMMALTYKEAVYGTGREGEVLINEDKSEESKRPSSRSVYWILMFASLCAFSLDGILGSYSSLIFAFSMHSLPTTEDRNLSAYLPATFWGFTLLGRLCGIFLILIMSSSKLLIMDMLGLLVSAVFFIIGQNSILSLFLATIGTGFFVSHCMPALLALTENKFIKVTQDAAVCLVSSAAFGEAVLPVVMAAVMHRISNAAYPTGHCIFVASACCLTTAYICLGRRRSTAEPLSRLFLCEIEAPDEAPINTEGRRTDEAAAAGMLNGDKMPLKLSPGTGTTAAGVTNYGSQDQLVDEDRH